MSSALDGLCGPGGSLHKEAPDSKEFAGLVQSGSTRLTDAERPENSLESRFDLAYNAAHALSPAALRRSGYRSSKRYIVFQVLPHTLGLGPEIWRVLDKAHSARNRSEYEGDLSIDERLLTDLIKACRTVLVSLQKLPPI